MQMMKVLLALTLLMLVVLVVHLQNKGNQDAGIGEKVFPELRSMLNDIDRLHLRSASGETNVTKKETAWVIEDKGGYPADFLKLSEFLNSVANAKYLERKTARADNHQQLGLLSPDKLDSNAVAVTVSSDADQLVDILLGNVSAHMEGRYFRFPVEDQVWLLDQDLEITADPVDWLEHVIIDVPEQDVERVVQSAYGAESFVLAREEGEEGVGNLMIQDLPAERKLLYPTVANELGRALVNLRLKDVLVDDEIDWSTANRTDFTCKNNLQLMVWSLEQDGRYFLRFNARLRDAESDGSRIRELAARLQPWVFEVGKITYEQFGKELSDFLVEESDEVNKT